MDKTINFLGMQQVADSNDAYLQAAFDRSLAGFLVLSGIKSGLAVIEGSEVGIGFMFAPVFHPAMKHASAPRREIGIRTVFNILGPLTNPAGAKAQVLGVAEVSLVEKLVLVLQSLGSHHALGCLPQNLEGAL